MNEWLAKNPYPESVFPDRDPKPAVEALQKAGIVPDGVFGCWARQVWDNACRAEARKLVEWMNTLYRWDASTFEQNQYYIFVKHADWQALRKEVGLDVQD